MLENFAHNSTLTQPASRGSSLILNWRCAFLCRTSYGDGDALGLKRLFRKKEKQEHRIMRAPVRPGDVITAEVEVLEFLRTLVTTIKPELVVETGTFMGVSTLWIAEAMRLNGFGRIVTCEYDPKVYETAREKFAASPVNDLIDLRNESSLEMKVDGTIDLFFSDSDMPIREEEVRRFLPQISPFGIILMHDASSHLKQVRDAALKMERDGLISVVLLPTPRGLVVAQKRESRK